MTFLKIINWFFVTLGVIFFIVLVALAYVWIADPYNLKPLFMGTDAGLVDVSTNAGVGAGASEQDVNENLNTSQEAALRTVGIDPADVPTEVTPEQEACFIEILGEERVQAIIEGAVPTGAEIFRGRACI